MLGKNTGKRSEEIKNNMKLSQQKRREEEKSIKIKGDLINEYKIRSL